MLSRAANKFPAPGIVAAGLCVCFLLASTFNTAVAQSQDTQTRLQQLNRDIENARRERATVEERAKEEESYAAELAAELVLHGERMRLQEGVLADVQRELADLRTRITETRRGLAEDRRQLGQLIAAMQRLSQHPPELVFIKPDESINSVRSASLLATILPRIREQAEALRNEMDVLQGLLADARTNEVKERQALETLRASREQMSELLDERQQRYQNLIARDAELARTITAMTEEARDLESLLQRLEESDAVAGLTGPQGSRSVPEGYPPAKPISQARGELVFPSSGRVIKRYGAAEEVGKARGITIRTPAGAQVGATWDGRIVFAGPFRNYGQVLIIAHGEGYHSLLAGMQRVYGQVGQWVLAGEPVGRMAGNPATTDNSVNDSETVAVQNGTRLNLYLELRRSGSPINPSPWLTRPLRKAEG